MVKRLIKKGLKTSILLGLKEAYFFLRNLLGLVYHPFKTLRVIFREKDYSQVTLIFGLPFYTFIAGLIFIIVVRFLIHAPEQWGILAKSLLSLLSLTCFLVFAYLLYWLIKILVPPKRRD